jgi:hypothetical protein
MSALTQHLLIGLNLETASVFTTTSSYTRKKYYCSSCKKDVRGDRYDHVLQRCTNSRCNNPLKRPYSMMEGNALLNDSYDRMKDFSGLDHYFVDDKSFKIA